MVTSLQKEIVKRINYKNIAQSSHQKHQNCIIDIVLVPLFPTLNTVYFHYMFKIQKCLIYIKVKKRMMKTRKITVKSINNE